MIRLECIQGSPEWHHARLGVLTASRITGVLTPAKCQRVKDWDPLMAELIHEVRTGHSAEDFGGNYHTERGKLLEPEALLAYGMVTDEPAELVGFVYRDDSKRVGCSPDWLTPPDGGQEVKCPAGKKHELTLIRGATPIEHVPQIQMSIWVCGAQWWDFVSYHPEAPIFIERHEPDPKWQAALSEHVPAFLAEMDEALEKLRLRGVKMEGRC